MSILIINIKELVETEEKPQKWVAGKSMSDLKSIKNAWLKTDGERIADFGEMPYPGETGNFKIIDATGKMVFPSFCDSHTHLVYAGSREIEYVDKIRGLSYEEIAARGGGILNSARRLHESSEDELVEQALARMDEIVRYGTGAVEIKS